MDVVVFETPAEREMGLQFMSPIPPGVLYVFPGIREGTWFHSRNVRERFDLAFLAEDGTVLLLATVVPEAQLVQAPRGTAKAVESKAGWLRHWGFVPGRRANI